MHEWELQLSVKADEENVAHGLFILSNTNDEDFTTKPHRLIMNSEKTTDKSKEVLRRWRYECCFRHQCTPRRLQEGLQLLPLLWWLVLGVSDLAELARCGLKERAVLQSLNGFGPGQ